VLAGRVAFVTGASRGIGRATALALAEAGAAVAVNYRSHEDAAREVAEAIRAAGGKALLAGGDVADMRQVEGAVSKTVEEFGRLDIAVSNAAFSARDLFHEADIGDFHRTIDVTMWGAFYTLRAATRQMLDQDNGGSIVFVSSPHAYLAIPRSMAYNMAKAAIDQMAKTAAIELAEAKIRVNIVHPGWIDTPGERRFATEEQIRAGGEKLPWKRLGTPEEVARGVVFLCDPAITSPEVRC
jgi:glucose 1-dehydrogenase